MYEKNGEKYFVVDSHLHFWDASPANWKPGQDVIIAGSVSDEDAKKQYPQGWKAPKPYIRIVPHPGA